MFADEASLSAMWQSSSRKGGIGNYVVAYLKLCEQRKWKRFVRRRLDLAAPSDDSVAASNLAAWVVLWA